MQEWNAFRRIEAAFNHEIPDKVPKYEGTIELKELNSMMNGQAAPAAVLFFTPQMLSFFHKVPAIVSLLKKLLRHPHLFYPLGRIVPQFVSKLHRQFHYDMFDYTAGVPIVFSERLFRDFTTEDHNRVVRNREGRIVWKTSLEGAHARYGIMQSPADWDKYLQFDPDHPGNYFLTESALTACKKLDVVPLFSLYGGAGFEELCSLFGFETLFKLLYTDKSFVKQAVKELNDFAIAVAEKVLQRGGQFLYFTSDLGFTGRSIISPRLFREFFKPAMTKFCRRVHQLGGKAMFHSCGNVVELLPDLVETGIDALHPIEGTAGNDILDFKRRFGKVLTLVGNVPIPLLTHGTPKENYDYVLYLLENISKDGGHIISSSHSITQWCKLENFYAYYKAVEDYGKYPIKIKKG